MEKEKAKYIPPEVDIFIFDSEDIMSLSSPGGHTPDIEDDPYEDSDW